VPIGFVMHVFDRFQPRNEALAKTVLFVLTWTAAGVTLLFTLAFPSDQTRAEAGTTVAACLAVLALVTAIKIASRPAPWLWAAYPFATIAMVAALDITSRDATVTAQVFFFFPVLYAGAQLRRHATVAICAAAVVADGVVTFTLLTAATAAIDLCFVGTALSASAALLLHAGERTDQLIAKLERQAAVDPLTGLLTRRVLDSAVSSALGGAANEGGTALLLMDIDNFKTVNDVHGHPAGDAVLQELARILMQLHRRGDVVSRMGGDEIAILLPGCALEVALQRAEEVVLEVRTHAFDVRPYSLATDPETAVDLGVTLSIGVAHLPTHANDLRELYAAADASLYEAKKSGRNRVGALRPLSEIPA
jgi:diguanylate cyclase (GGDEF)-like protein